MTYADISKKKLFFTIGLALVLLLLVDATFMSKRSHYGETPFYQAVGWVAYKTFYGLWYDIRAFQLSNNTVSATILEQAHAGQGAEAIPVLVYHSVTSETEEINFDRASFAEHMFALKEAGWQTITLDEFQRFMREGIPLPRRSVLLTFDDGAKNSFHPVDPVLEALGFTAVSFILPKFSTGAGTHYYLSAAEIDHMLETGRWEIGSHGKDLHKYSAINEEGTIAPALVNRIWLEEQGRNETEREYVLRITDDLVSAKEMLESRFKVPITSFAFPFGEFGQMSINIPDANDVVTPIATNLHETSFYQWWEGEGLSFNYPSSVSTRFYKRISPEVDWSGDKLVALLEKGLPKKLPYTSTLTEDEGWIRNWGTLTYETNGLRLTPSLGGTGGTVFLDGTGHWGDYLVTAKIHSPNKSGATILVRFKDRKNYALCNYGKGFLHIEQFVAGEHRVIKGLREQDLAPDEEYEMQVYVDGRDISCGINNKTTVSTEFLDPSLETGGIGLKTWDATNNDADITVTELLVMPVS